MKIKIGVFAGLLAAILFLGPFAFFNPLESEGWVTEYGEIIGYGVQALSMLLILFGMKKLAAGREVLSFGESFISGMVMTAVATLVFYLGNALFYEVLYPNFLTDFMEYYGPKMLEKAESEEERQALEAQMQAWEPFIANGWLYAGLMCMSVFGFGLLFSIIGALIFKKSQS